MLLVVICGLVHLNNINMDRYKLLYNKPRYERRGFTAGEIYEQNARIDARFLRVEELVARFPNDWQLIEDDFELPEKWCVKVTSKTCAEIHKWMSKRPSMYKLNVGDYAYGNNKKEYTSWLWKAREDTPEITFEQFKKYVLGMKDKKIIGYKLKDNAYKYEKAAIKILNSKSNNTILTWLNSKIIFGKDSSAERKFKDAGVLGIWFEPVYEEEYKLPIINGYKGKDLGDGRVKYGCKTIQVDTLRDLYSITIASINIENNWIVTAKDIKQILDYFDNK